MSPDDGAGPQIALPRCAPRPKPGDVVLIAALVHDVDEAAGLVVTRIATRGSAGGPGFRQDVFQIGVIAAIAEDPMIQALARR